MAFTEVSEGLFIISPKSMTEVEKLPVGTYNITVHPSFGYCVQRTTDFTLPAKIYGDNPHLVKTMKHRFLEERTGKVTTAVLSGLKGSGKTLAAKQIANECREEHCISTFLVSHAFAGQSFNTYLTELQAAQGAPIILLVDEFEKIYTDQDNINGLLTLLDGTATLHMCVLLTMNTSLDERRFEFFKNRPGRAYFNKHFETCPEKVIREYCQDNLQYSDKIEEVVSFSYRFNAFTLDLLSTLVKEINLTEAKVALDEICTYINIKPDVSASAGAYVVRSFNATTRQPLTPEQADNVLVGYDFADDVLRYHDASVAFYIYENDPRFAAMQTLHKDLAKGEDLDKSNMHRIVEGILFEAAYNRVRLDEDDEDGNAQYKKEFKYYKVTVNCAIQHPDEPDARVTGSLGIVNYSERKVTFEIPFVDLTLVLESRNRRVDDSRRLIL